MYKCIKCGKPIPDAVIDQDMPTGQRKCSYCGSKTFKKANPPIVRKVDAAYRV